MCVTKSLQQKSAMIGLRERERTRERRVSLARAGILLLWVMLVFALIVTLFFSINNETKNNNNNNHSNIRLLRQRTFNKALLSHAPSKQRTRTTHHHDQARTTTNVGDPLYGDDKRLIHTGPNPLHN
ncbi:hypothetical protein MtrunA17_Chr4g0043881 [Medicago truncatula]|uniref:Clavata3/ESR (CLE) gene family member n=1 Tax=Medicago truncatula TaxID=3880 RepID=A0A396IEH6_MEDTR|nr:hypothetical protein MtrunA17_Chr4g0043881 [Medicago truncatula]